MDVFLADPSICNHSWREKNDTNDRAPQAHLRRFVSTLKRMGFAVLPRGRPFLRWLLFSSRVHNLTSALRVHSLQHTLEAEYSSKESDKSLVQTTNQRHKKVLRDQFGVECIDKIWRECVLWYIPPGN